MKPLNAKDAFNIANNVKIDLIKTKINEVLNVIYTAIQNSANAGCFQLTFPIESIEDLMTPDRETVFPAVLKDLEENGYTMESILSGIKIFWAPKNEKI